MLRLWIFFTCFICIYKSSLKFCGFLLILFLFLIMTALKSLPDNSNNLLFHCWHQLFVFFIQFEISLVFGMNDIWLTSVQFCTVFWDSRPYQNLLFYMDFSNIQVGVGGGSGTASLLPRGPEVCILHWTLADTPGGGTFLVSARQLWKVEIPCCLITTWCSEQPDSTTGFLWHHPSCGGNTHYCQVQVKIQSPCFTFSKTTLRGCHIVASAPIQLCWHGWIWAPVFSVLFDLREWWLFW